MAREWGEQQPDGSVRVYRQDDNGAVTLVRTESMAQNQGQPAAGGSTSGAPDGGGTIATPNGAKTLAQIRSEMQAAGYNGPWDEGSLVSAYSTTAGAASALGGSGGENSYANFTAINYAMQAAQLAAQIAMQNKQLEFQKFQFSNLSEAQKQAMIRQDAVQAWTQAFQQATLDYTKQHDQQLIDQNFRIHGDRLQYDRESRALDERYRRDSMTLQKELAAESREHERGLQRERLGSDASLQRERLQFEGGENEKNRGIQAAGLVLQATGPRNAFTQQAVMHGLNQQGLSKSVDAIAGKWAPPSFQAPQARPQPITLQTLADDMSRASSGVPFVAPLPPLNEQPPPAGWGG